MATHITGPDIKPADLLDQLKIKLDEFHAEDIVSIDLRGKTDIADYMLIATGRSNRHVASTAQKVADFLKELGYKSLHVEGQEAGEWVLVDVGDIVLHIFHPEMRRHYNLEKMWSMEMVEQSFELPSTSGSPVVA